MAIRHMWWDHVSWPGNDFYGGSRSTDDGVKAAATDSMAALTGVEGRYAPNRGGPMFRRRPAASGRKLVIGKGQRL